MTTRIIRDEGDMQSLYQLLGNKKLPITVNVVQGADRTNEQNKLQRLWLNEAAEQLADETAEEKRAYCKLHFGVPLLRAESEEFCAAYDKLIRPLDYETKLALMSVPLDFPVTRLMTTKQKTRYLDAMWKHFSDIGVQLTEPKKGDARAAA